jgi:hypothetical protein
MLAAQGLLQVSLSTGKQHEYTLACHRTQKFRGYGHRATSICFDRKRNSIWLNTSDGLIQFTLIDKKFHQMVEFNTVVNEKPRNQWFVILLHRWDGYRPLWKSLVRDHATRNPDL